MCVITDVLLFMADTHYLVLVKIGADQCEAKSTRFNFNIVCNMTVARYFFNYVSGLYCDLSSEDNIWDIIMIRL